MMSPRTRKAWLSAAGALGVLAAGVVLNRTAGLSQDWVLFPVSLLYNRVPDWVPALGWPWLSESLFGNDTYPLWFRGGVLVAHLGIWASIIYGCLSLRDRSRDVKPGRLDP